jgi:hypothetical protein
MKLHSSQPNSQGNTACRLLIANFLPGLLVDPDDGSDIFF